MSYGRKGTVGMLDATDRRILELLRQDARRQHKEIGEQVHLTGQAVGARIRKLEEAGIIEGVTLKVNPAKLGLAVNALITVYMKTTSSHSSFQQWVQQQPAIAEAHRVSGEGCYWLHAHTADHEELNRLLDELLRYGNYKVQISIGQIKG
ncbi:Lrp/AsnC family transcriptional regulator [Paenibacillus sp. GD4]|jgi:Lrp/AsnC family transcriptional regulator, leucine-responsive regulatory protein|uniref:Lrp/AsnC family transcriptional regulator n=1 Tax=Paenibacillus sp. GD4 TaxID=3068890 RepID=UPI002796C5B3|nr:Lrp/AsnC family transcriptional regulator [Paenibacillus sp. GD4]MDQ1911021.1 Lrp/AsnC family transcriptional regulator [Paenibacillus sp. GD4]